MIHLDRLIQVVRIGLTKPIFALLREIKVLTMLPSPPKMRIIPRVILLGCAGLSLLIATTGCRMPGNCCQRERGLLGGCTCQIDCCDKIRCCPMPESDSSHSQSPVPTGQEATEAPQSPSNPPANQWRIREDHATETDHISREQSIDSTTLSVLTREATDEPFIPELPNTLIETGLAENKGETPPTEIGEAQQTTAHLDALETPTLDSLLEPAMSTVSKTTQPDLSDEQHSEPPASHTTDQSWVDQLAGTGIAVGIETDSDPTRFHSPGH